MSIYLIGSLRNQDIPVVASELRADGHDVFDDWYSAGPNADDHWRDYEQKKGHSFEKALNGYAARHVVEFDQTHLDRCDIGVLVMPAGKSGHLELGYMTGQGKLTYILLDGDPDRFDVMYGLVTRVFSSLNKLKETINEQPEVGRSVPGHGGIYRAVVEGSK